MTDILGIAGHAAIRQKGFSDRPQRELLPREDDYVSEDLRKLFADEGIDILLNSQTERASGRSGQSVKITLEQNGAEKTLEGSHVLVASGRTPNTTDRGYVKVNEHLQTTGPGVWAIGEVAGSPRGLPYTGLRDAILTHPTLAEGLGALFSSESSPQNQRARTANP